MPILYNDCVSDHTIKTALLVHVRVKSSTFKQSNGV